VGSGLCEISSVETDSVLRGWWPCLALTVAVLEAVSVGSYAECSTTVHPAGGWSDIQDSTSAHAIGMFFGMYGRKRAARARFHCIAGGEGVCQILMSAGVTERHFSTLYL